MGILRYRPAADELAPLLKFWQEQYDYFENNTAAAVNVAVPRSRYRAEREKGADPDRAFASPRIGSAPIAGCSDRPHTEW